MYAYEWDKETGGLLLTSELLKFSKEPRPVYYRELDTLGFDEIWQYEKNDEAPYMWAESNNYWYKGVKVAKTRGGSLHCKPELIVLEEPSSNTKLEQVNVSKMISKNEHILDSLVQETIKKVYNIFNEYKEKVDVFYVAFSGGKDSVVALDIVQRALPHNEFKVLFGDTGMEFPDTYEVIGKISKWCNDNNIEFIRAKSDLSTDETWSAFGPPAVTNRWCCSIHKTSPQIMALKELTGLKTFTGMAFTGVRGDESAARKEYDDVSFGGKHQGQFSCHTILDWNSAELYLYIYQRNLILNEAYKRGNSRAGCLVCPMSSGRHEFIKNECYSEQIKPFLNKISETSGKEDFDKTDMFNFIEEGNWKTRKSGRELNFGTDKHIVDVDNGNTYVTVFNVNDEWKEWAKTIGPVEEYSDCEYSVEYESKSYRVLLTETKQGTKFSFPNTSNKKQDIKFLSLIKSCIIKSVYCVCCGCCIAECPFGCIDMTNGFSISDECRHCHKCHEIHEHCLRYNSIRNRIGTERKMKGLGHYYTFGVKEDWLDTYFKYKGTDEFWDTDGDYKLGKKMKDAMLNFLKDAEMIERNKSVGHDKYTRNNLTEFGETIVELYDKEDKNSLWALMLCNLVYSPDFNWFVKNISFDEIMTPDRMKLQLESVMENDAKGLGKRNVVSAFKNILIRTPLGEDLGLGVCDYDAKVNSAGVETLTLNSFCRKRWINPDPRVILYSLYLFAEKCDGYYSFTLSRIMNTDVESEGVSPVSIFGFDRESMEKLLSGLSVNYPEFINASFTHDLDNITLRNDKKSMDVLELFKEVM